MAVTPTDYFTDTSPAAQLDAWRQEYRQKLEATALDFDNYEPSEDPWVRQRAIIYGVLEAETDQDPGDGLAYEMLRDQVADQLFKGKGRGSDEAFFGEYKKAAQFNAHAKALSKTMEDAAALSATAQSTDFFSRDLSTYAQWREKARTSPGYDPKREADYLEAWEDMREAVNQRIEPYLGPLSQVWSEIKTDPGVVGDRIKDAYWSIPEGDRQSFMASLSVLAKGLPKEEQAAFWSNLKKQSGRDVGDLGRQTLEGIKEFSINATVGFSGDPGLIAQGQIERDERNFVSDVLNIQRADYDPMRYLRPEGWQRDVEKGVYGAPGALATTAAAAVPVVGQGALFFTMQGAAYEDTRRRLLNQGVSDAEASKFASEAAPFVGAANTLLERVQAQAIFGKVPGIEKAVAAVADRIQNRAARFGLRTVAGAATETGIEQTQNFMPAFAQEVGSALGAEIPDVQWTGKGGELDGFWNQSLSTFVTVLPLALIGAAGGVDADARTKAFTAASDAQLEAFLGSKESVASIRAAQVQGDYSLGQAVGSAVASRDPNSEVAKAAVEQIKAEAEAQQQAAQQAERSGAIPRFVRDADGWTVYDGETQEEVGKAPDAAGALKLAETHSAAIDRKDADMVAYLATMLEAGDTQNAGDGKKRQTTTDFRPGEAVTTAQQALTSPGDESRVAAQVAAKERLNGGDGSMAQLVLGQSTTETKQRVRRTVNRINAGASVLTVFHEEAHGFFREALATGRLTKEDTISTIRALETVLAYRKAKDGQALRFLPENDADIDDTSLDEAVSELVEAEVLRTRKGGGARQLPGGVISRNLTAAAKLSGGARKFSAFLSAIRAYFGLAFSRAVAIRQGIKEGKIDKAKLDEFTTKLFGLNEQDEHEAAAAKEAAAIVGEEIEGDPFSLGPAALADAIIAKATEKIKDPQQKAKVFTGIVERMGKIKRLIAERGVAYNFDAFGKPYEGDISDEKSGDLNALAMLDGILMALPPDLRGRVGGYTQLAKLNTDGKRRDYLKRKVDSVDKVVEKWLQGESSKMLDKLLERAAPKKEGGKKAKGKLGAEAHRYFEQVSEVREKSADEIEALLTQLDTKMGAATTDADRADIAEAYQIAVAFGNFKEKSAAEMLASLDLAQSVYDTGRNRWKTLEEARLSEVKALGQLGLTELGNPVGQAAIQAGKNKAAKLLSKVQGGKWSLLSFVEVAEGMYGRDSQLAKRWGKAVRDGFRKRTSGILAAQERWKVAIEAATGKTGRKARRQVWDMANVQSIKATPLPVRKETLRVPIDTFFEADQQKSLGLTKEEIAQLTEQFENLPEGSRKQYLELERTTPVATKQAEFSEAEAISLTMLWSQDGYKDGMRLHGLGEDFQAELESQLSDAAKAIRLHLAKEYADNFEPLRALFSRMYGVDLQQTENYSPGKFFSQGESDTPIDAGGAGFVEGGFKQSFLKTRKKHKAEARAENAFSTYFSHLNQTEHWKAMAEISREMHGVLGNPEMKKALLATNPDGAHALNEWLKAIDGNGFNNAPESWLLDSLMKSQAYLAMAWKASTILKNGIGAAVNAAYRMPVKDYANGWRRLMSGKIEFRHVWDSDLIQNRLKGGFAPEARAAISQAFGAKPTMRGDFLVKGMEVIGTADAFGTACGAAITYDYHYRQARKGGLSHADAEALAMDAAAETISRTAQPSEVTDRSLMELRLHGIGRLAFVFASEARQKSALWLTAWQHTLTGKATAADLRVLAISHLVMGPLMQAVSAMVRDSTNHDDDNEWLWFDEKYWNPKDFLFAMATGPLGGLPLVRDVIDNYSGDSGPLKRLIDSGHAAKKLFADEPKGDEADWYERQITKVLQGLGPAPAVGSSVFDQIYDFLRNATD